MDSPTSCPGTPSTGRAEQLALVYVERLLTAWCIGYGMAIALVPHGRVPPNAISDFALEAGVSPRAALAAAVLLPGLLMLWPRLRTAGLWGAVCGVGVFEVGLVSSALQGRGTATAPVGLLLPLAVAAVLLGHRRAVGRAGAR